MKKREGVSLALKVAGVFLWVQIAPSLLSVFSMIFHISNSPTVWMKLLTVVLMILLPGIWILICLVVIRKSDRIAARLVQEDGDASQIFSLSFQDTQTLAYTFIGLFVVVHAFPELLRIISQILLAKGQSPLFQDPQFIRHTLPLLVAFAAQLIIGLYLFFQAKGLTFLWQRLQEKTRPMKYESDNQ